MKCYLGVALLVLAGCGQTPPPAPLTPRESPTPGTAPANELLSLVREAVRRNDYDSLDTLRERPIEEIIEPMVQDYDKATEWRPRDAIVYLYQDTNDARLMPIMRHALDSPSVESRAIAICSLSNDRKRFETFLVDGKLDETKVNAAVAELRKSKP